jgi:hypothetical protein
MTMSVAAGGAAGTGAATFGVLLTTTGTTAFTTGSGQTWNVGGMKATLNQCLVTVSGLKNVLAAGDIIYAGAGTYRETVANAVSGSQLTTTYNGTNGSSLTTLGSVITLTSVSGLVAPPVGYYNQGSVVTSAGVVGFTWTGISGSTLTGVTFLVNSTVTASATVASSAVLLVSTPIWVIGDVDGAQTGQAGQVTHSAFTTNDTTAPSSTVLNTLTTTTNISFGLITFIGGTGNPGCFSNSATTTPSWYTFIDCMFNAIITLGNNAATFNSSTTGQALGIVIDRCTVVKSLSAGFGFTLTTTASGSADWDALVRIQNSFFAVGNNGVTAAGGGTAANNGGGVRMFNCDVIGAGGNGFTAATALHLSTNIPCNVYNSFIMGSGGLNAGTSGQLIEDYNVLIAMTPRTNVSTGTHSQTTAYAPLLELGQSFKWAGVFRQFMAPDGPSSPLLGFGSAAGSPTVDWANRPRPSGGKSASNAVGYSELHDFGIQDTVTFPSGQTSSAKLIGPGDNDIWVPVDAVSTTIAIQLNQGSGYGGSVFATATIEASGELGIASQTQTCSSTLNAWQTLTFSAISASKAGWVKVRISSFDTSGTGTLNFGALTAV